MKAIIKILLIGCLCFSLNGMVAQNNNFLLGKVAFNNSDYQKAISFLGSHLQNYPGHQEARLLRAKAFLALANYSEAKDELLDLKYFQNNEILMLQARAYAGMGNNKQVFEKLEQYRNTNNKISDHVILSYPEFQSLKNTAEWANLWSKWQYSEKELALNNICFAIKSERFGEAAERLDNFLIKYKTSAEAFYLRGNIHFRDKNFKDALDCYENAIDLDNSSEYLMGRALTLHELKRDKKALEDFNAIINKDSLIIDSYKGRAETFLALSDFHSAYRDIIKFRSYYPDSNDALFIEAQINVQLGDFLSAIANYGKLLKANPSRPEYFIGRADAYVQTKTYTYAIRDYSMALDLNPRYVEVYKKKARAHQLSGDLKNACINWDYAIRLGDIESIDLKYKYCRD